MKRTRVMTLLMSVVALTGILSVASPVTADAATKASATAPGATFRGTIYQGFNGGATTTISGTLTDTHRTNGHPAALQVRSQKYLWGDGRLHTSGITYQAKTTTKKYGVGPRTHAHSSAVKSYRLQYRVCSHTHCSSWQSTKWRRA